MKCFLHHYLSLSVWTNIFFLNGLLWLPLSLAAQTEKSDTIAEATTITLQVGKTKYKGDSIPHILFPALQKYPPLSFANAKEAQRYQLLVANIKKVLPFAKLARLTLIETYEVLELLPTEKARTEHLKAMEASIKAQYTPVFKKLTRSQGRLLVKLIDRECGQSGYQIAAAFLGSFRANVYQGVAFIFGQSLTKRYDPEGDDFMVERTIRMIESGQL